MIKIKISKTLQSKIRKGYPWVFKYQVQNQIPEGKQENLAVVYDHQNHFLAMGLWDPHSDLCFRVLNLGKPKEISDSFFLERLQSAMMIRKELESQGTTGYRIINGENDQFPGLVLDRYEDTLVLKLYTSSWFPFLEKLCEIFQKEFTCQQVVLRLARNVSKDVGSKSIYRDGQVLYGQENSGWVQFKENGLKFTADVIEGQKTGFFLDQRDNRLKVMKMAKGLSVLNVFSYSGGFSVYALAGGCSSVMEVDCNPIALETSLRNLKLNFPEKQIVGKNFTQREGDAFQILAQLKSEKYFFDLVILDPPAFARKKKHKTQALEAYTALAKAGAKLTSGALFAASCSSHVSSKEFYDAVYRGIRSTGKRLEEINRTGHAQDHPAIFSEALYLKSTYIRVGP